MPGLHHLALRTHHVATVVRFYQEWFELQVLRDAMPRSVWLALDGNAVLMVEAAGPEEPPIPSASLELVALRVSVERRAALRALLVAAGRLEAETAHTLYFRDPDGRRVGASSYELR
jgi:catechol 2,3-dioxygenase-like lactoylglutathione lyase family enzyme